MDVTKNGSACPARDLEELVAQRRVVFVVAPPERSPGTGLLLSYASHLGAEMDSLDMDRDTVRIKQSFESVGDLLAYAFLKRESAGAQTHQTPESWGFCYIFLGGGNQ